MLKAKRKIEKIFQNKEMSFWDHLEEMRWMIFKCIAVIFVAMVLVGVAFFYFNSLLMYPLKIAEESLGSKIELRSLGPMSPFMIMIYIVFGGGFFLSLPFILFFIARFVAPGLTSNERRMLFPACVSALLLFCLGVAFSFFLVLPFGLRFSDVIATDLLGVSSLWDAETYYSFLIWVTFALGGAFELPLIIVILIALGVLEPKTLRKNRRYVILGIAVFAMLITPPDGVTMLMVLLPLCILFEIALWVGTVLRKKKLKQEAEQEALDDAQEAKERKEYAAQILDERKREMEEEKLARSKESASTSSGSTLPDDYDPNDISNDPYYDDHEYGYYDDYEKMAEEDAAYEAIPVRNFSPNWELNKPSTDFFAPKFDEPNADK